MGANTFYHPASGKNAKKAFIAATKEAAYNYGHSGYTGSIAEKESFIMISEKVFESYDEACKLAYKLIDEDDERLDDKWGPAGCLKYKDRTGGISYLFFGLAPA